MLIHFEWMFFWFKICSSNKILLAQSNLFSSSFFSLLNDWTLQAEYILDLQKQLTLIGGEARKDSNGSLTEESITSVTPVDKVCTFMWFLIYILAACIFLWKSEAMVLFLLTCTLLVHTEFDTIWECIALNCIWFKLTCSFLP